MRELDMDTLMFFDARPDTLPLYQAFEEKIYTIFPVVKKLVQKTQITFDNRHVFACVSILTCSICQYIIF